MNISGLELSLGSKTDKSEWVKLIDLELRGLNNIYFKTNNNKRDEVYYDEMNNNYILFEPLDDECDTESICNSIRNSAYEYMINVLNNNKNVVVLWSQIEGTTSDYVIYYDVEINKESKNSFDKISDILDDKVKENNTKGYKYTEVVDGVVNTIDV